MIVDINYNKHRIKAIRDIMQVLPKVYKLRKLGYNWKSIGLVLDGK